MDKQPSMEGIIVQRLFAALALSKKLPTTFGVQAMNPDGIRVMRVLAIDDVLWQQKVLPALKAAGVEVAAIALDDEDLIG
jgi:hypothetical protein